MNYTKIYNGTAITPSGLIKGATVVICGDKIEEVTTSNVSVPGALKIDAKGKFIAPGFIDMHVHGGGGHDFMDNTVDAFLAISREHAKYGTTAMMPTTLSCEKQDLLETIETYEKASPLNQEGAQFVGLHIEGPYFAMNQKGAQDPKYIRNPDPDEYHEILSSTKVIKRWSAAPELPGALQFADALKEKNILAAIAHTDAIYEDVVKAYDAGFRHATHFYSCMSGVSRRNAYRYAGVVESAYLIDGMSVEIIADGVHLPTPLLKLVYKIKGAAHTALITDAMRAAGMGEGKSILGSLQRGMEVVVEDGVAKLPDRSAFAGSVATTDQLVRKMIELAEVSLPDAVKMITETPAQILGLGHLKGSLTKGRDADIVIFDNHIRIDTTIVNGKVVYQNQAPVLSIP
ncbi:N-acetylglucosamine-6-phosphate deacetylase [Pedobacter yulinensis]|uniref:N-acetylglucosamine-6-phosphate deacetylase n=1 Tax=Pedobacter yulinensis TaxID=2126353 RepID=A0A2T3HJX6_9SPHI|nr:N-acetylglucosamine-6-phosphate deacetylase [Pedobacter yulinensis]PST82681.1 N-acetylglucosamine-6-phosphate deacetylase [Pedobacter yulinensis]